MLPYSEFSGRLIRILKRIKKKLSFCEMKSEYEKRHIEAFNLNRYFFISSMVYYFTLTNNYSNIILVGKNDSYILPKKHIKCHFY